MDWVHAGDQQWSDRADEEELMLLLTDAKHEQQLPNTCAGQPMHTWQANNTFQHNRQGNAMQAPRMGASWLLQNCPEEELQALMAAPWPQAPLPPMLHPSAAAAAGAAASQWCPPANILQAVEQTMEEIESGLWDDELFSSSLMVAKPPQPCLPALNLAHGGPCTLDGTCDLSDNETMPRTSSCCNNTFRLPDAMAEGPQVRTFLHSNASTFYPHGTQQAVDQTAFESYRDTQARQWAPFPSSRHYVTAQAPATPTAATSARGSILALSPTNDNERRAMWHAVKGAAQPPQMQGLFAQSIGGAAAPAVHAMQGRAHHHHQGPSLPRSKSCPTAGTAGPAASQFSCPPMVPKPADQQQVTAPSQDSLSGRPRPSGGVPSGSTARSGNLQALPTLRAMQELFLLPVEQARHALQLSKNRFSEACRQHGIKRWPQRQLVGLSRLMDSIQSDKGLTESVRKKHIAEALANEEAIFEGREVDVRKCLQKLSHVYHNRKHLHKSSRQTSCPSEVIVIEDSAHESDG